MNSELQKATVATSAVGRKERRGAPVRQGAPSANRETENRAAANWTFMQSKP